MLQACFTKKYDQSKLQSFGPYIPETTAPSSASNTTAATSHHHHRDWVVPVAVVVPVVVVGALLGVLIFMCCRKARKDRSMHEQNSYQEANNRKSWIVPWIWSTSSAGNNKDVATDSSVTEVEHQHPHSPPPMAQVHPHELEGGGGGYFLGSSNNGDTRERWSQSTQVRSPKMGYAGPVEGMNTEVHEVHGSSRKPDDTNYDIRNMAMYPPSVVSGDIPERWAVPQSRRTVIPAGRARRRATHRAWQVQDLRRSQKGSWHMAVAMPQGSTEPSHQLMCGNKIGLRTSAIPRM